MSLCLSTMGLALYRNQSMKAYFQDQKGVYAFAIFAILIKIIFFFILYMGGEGVITYAYIGQALLMVFLVFTSSRLFFK